MKRWSLLCFTEIFNNVKKRIIERGFIMTENIQEGVVLTPDGKKKLEEELYDLKVVKRAQVVKDIAEARAHGDLSENAEYDEAKNEEARVHSRIAQLEELLANAIIVDAFGPILKRWHAVKSKAPQHKSVSFFMHTSYLRTSPNTLT